MTLNAHKVLEQYFHTIIKPTQKEQTMFDIFKTTAEKYTDILKARFNELTTTRYEFKEEPVQMMEEDYWAFEMYTGEWIDEEGEKRPIKHSVIIEPHEGTWPEVLDRILDEMGKHYGYNIKEQVYYSVNFPMNGTNPLTGEPMPGNTRLLNDEVLQQLLLAFPEVYKRCPSWDKPTNVFE